MGSFLDTGIPRPVPRWELRVSFGLVCLFVCSCHDLRRLPQRQLFKYEPTRGQLGRDQCSVFLGVPAAEMWGQGGAGNRFDGTVGRVTMSSI